MAERARNADPIRFGVVGLGTAGAAIIPPLGRNPSFSFVAAADRDQETLARLQADFPQVRGFTSAEALVEEADVDAVFIATPTQHHTAHVLAALNAGKHVVTEKPIATNLEDAAAMIEAADRNDQVLMVGHSFSYETPIREMRRIVSSGELGPLRMVNNWYFTDWIYRPRNPEELDSNLGGGVTFRQGSHQFDIIRMVGGGLVRSVRAVTGRWDSARPTEGAHAVLLEFENGTAATAVYSGYDHFHSAELTFGIGEGGAEADLSVYARARKTLAGAGAGGEATLKRNVRYGGANARSRAPAPYQPFYGLTVASCEGGDIRQSPEGLIVYGPEERREVPLEKGVTGRDSILMELRTALVDGQPPVHDGRWGMANLEVCLAVLESARERREVYLSHQKAVND